MQRDTTSNTAVRTITQEVRSNGINEQETFTSSPDPVGLRLCYLLA